MTKIEDGEELSLHRRGRRAARDRPPRSERAHDPRSRRSRINDEESRRTGVAARPLRTLKGRRAAPAQTGDFVSIDLSATVNGEELPTPPPKASPTRWAPVS